MTGRGAYSRAKKSENRQRLLEAAAEVFERMGYSASSVDDIAQGAEVSRVTFYRHFESKIHIGLALYDSVEKLSMPYWQALGPKEARSRVRVQAWLKELLEFFASRPGAMRVFMEMTTIEPAFLRRASAGVPVVIAWLGARIPAFSGIDVADHKDTHHTLEAWLLVSEIIDQFSSAAIGFLPFGSDGLTEVVAAHFIRFVKQYDHVTLPKPAGTGTKVRHGGGRNRSAGS